MLKRKSVEAGSDLHRAARQANRRAGIAWDGDFEHPTLCGAIPSRLVTDASPAGKRRAGFLVGIGSVDTQSTVLADGHIDSLTRDY